MLFTRALITLLVTSAHSTLSTLPGSPLSRDHLAGLSARTAALRPPRTFGFRLGGGVFGGWRPSGCAGKKIILSLKRFFFFFFHNSSKQTIECLYLCSVSVFVVRDRLVDDVSTFSPVGAVWGTSR